MRKTITRSISIFAVVCLTSFVAFGQTLITGTISDDIRKEPLAGISIAVQGKVIGTITDTRGNFSLSTNTPRPFVIAVTGVGFAGQQFTISNPSTSLDIVLKEQALVGQEVVVSASRIEESVLKSPVSVEKMSLRDIQTTPSANFYDGLANIKGVDIATQGLLFKSINLRGFGATGNPRTVQLIDGMDNSAPGLNFPVDNIVGIPEQDVESVEILPGAASALYGPNAIQGLILMNSKSPFLYQGLSANVKTGVMSASNRPTPNTGFYDASIRYAKAFNNKLAFKVNLSYLKAKDWEATNYTDLNNPQNPNSNPDRTVAPLNYDGMNIYGDENQQGLRSVVSGVISSTATPAAVRGALQAASNAGIFPDVTISRTGYQERDVVDYNTKSFKANGALHYRITEKIEAIAQVNYGFGTTVYTANGRYSLRDFSLTQGKLELRGDNFTLRGYTTQERSGKSYTAGLATIYLNEAWSPSTTWYPEYAVAYAQARGAGQADAAAQVTARAFADRSRPAPGSDGFNTLYNAVSTNPISSGKGGGFLDNSALYHGEGVYNFKNQIKAVDVLVGANVRQYQLISNGTLFADQVEGRNGKIKINEYGAFIQASKSIFADHLKLTASTRYDKNQNFDGQFTPRVSAVATFGEHNIRLSYQTGFRIPTTQNQYIDLQTPQARLLGGLPEFYQRYGLSNAYSRASLSTVATDIAALASTSALQGQVQAALIAQFTPIVTAAVTASVLAGQIPASQATAAVTAGVTAAVTANIANAVRGQATNTVVGNLKTYQPKEFKPERVASYEIGYRSVFNRRLFVDAYYYYSVYTNFIGAAILLQPIAPAAQGLSAETGILDARTRRAYSIAANSSERITSSGWAIGMNYALPKGYGLSGNLANNELNNFKATEELQTSGFNTPKYRWNLGFTKRAVGGSNIGFGIAFKHQSSFEWQGFGQPTQLNVPLYSNTIVPVINNLDAQVNYKVQTIKSIIKVGATNLFGKPYFQAYGSPYLGTTYYVGITFDELLN